jgi:hypothetical protein
MGYRRYTDRDGQAWDVRDVSSSEWEFVPVAGNPAAPLRVPAPGYESDPFELSNEELTRLFDAAPRPRSRPKKSPFRD